MSSIKNIILTVVVVAVLGIQVAYFMTVYRTEQETIANNKEEIRLTQMRIEELEKRIQKLPETQKELELVSAEKQAILNMLPSYTAISKNTVELFRYMDINDFAETGCKTIEDESYETQDGIKRYSYELSFIGRYGEIIEFVNNLNQSYQVTNVQSLVMDNSVQDLQNEENLIYLAHYGEDFPQVVRATLSITMYARYDEEMVEQEIYQPDLELRSNPDSLFAFVQSEEVEEEAVLEDEILEEEEENSEVVDITPIIDTDDTFTLSVGDRITSGDTYKLDGPGSQMEDYVGLITDTNIEVAIEVYEDHYKMSMTDKNGEREETEVQIPIEEPRLNIISTMRQLDDVMPNIHVYVHNHTQTVMEVSLTGSLLDHIYVFNGQDEQMTKGETKGNIKLT